MKKKDCLLNYLMWSNKKLVIKINLRKLICYSLQNNKNDLNIILRKYSFKNKYQFYWELLIVFFGNFFKIKFIKLLVLLSFYKYDINFRFIKQAHILLVNSYF